MSLLRFLFRSDLIFDKGNSKENRKTCTFPFGFVVVCVNRCHHKKWDVILRLNSLPSGRAHVLSPQSKCARWIASVCIAESLKSHDFVVIAINWMLKLKNQKGDSILRRSPGSAQATYLHIFTHLNAAKFADRKINNLPRLSKNWKITAKQRSELLSSQSNAWIC